MQKLKRLVLFFTLILLLSTLALAQTNDTNSSTPPKIINPKDPTPKIDEKLESNLKIPGSLKIASQFLFGIRPNDSVSLSSFIILLVIWAWIFIIIESGLKFVPFLKGWATWVGSLIITLLVAYTKAILHIAQFWLDIGNSFKILDEWNLGALIVTALTLILLIIITITLKEKIDKKMRKLTYEIDKEEIKKGITVIKKSSKELN